MGGSFEEDYYQHGVLSKKLVDYNKLVDGDKLYFLHLYLLAVTQTLYDAIKRHGDTTYSPLVF